VIRSEIFECNEYIVIIIACWEYKNTCLSTLNSIHKLNFARYIYTIINHHLLLSPLKYPNLGSQPSTKPGKFFAHLHIFHLATYEYKRSCFYSNSCFILFGLYNLEVKNNSQILESKNQEWLLNCTFTWNSLCFFYKKGFKL